VAKLDLHGETHDNAKNLTAKFLEKNLRDKSSVLEIVTGHSDRMREIVMDVLLAYDLEWYLGTGIREGTIKVIVEDYSEYYDEYVSY